MAQGGSISEIALFTLVLRILRSSLQVTTNNLLAREGGARQR